MNLNKLRLFSTRLIAVIYFLLFYHIRKDVLKEAFWIGVFFVFFGETIRLVAQSTIKKNKELAKDGLYKIVRHPLYLGSFFIFLGFFCFHITKNFHPEVFVFWVICIFMLCLIYRKKIKDEEEYLAKIFPQYKEYMEEVPCIIPKFQKTNFKINPKQIIKNREHKLLIGLILMLLLIYKGVKG
ncbi:MAG: isoprenylcysteine carboxylmethyltransferase family protein [Elusimicrobia bacterium]|nr:isoprenylcysteine carboxylmethyltransferase family protein [Elusimicrobiota bacterium]